MSQHVTQCVLDINVDHHYNYNRRLCLSWQAMTRSKVLNIPAHHLPSQAVCSAIFTLSKHPTSHPSPSYLRMLFDQHSREDSMHTRQGSKWRPNLEFLWLSQYTGTLITPSSCVSEIVLTSTAVAVEWHAPPLCSALLEVFHAQELQNAINYLILYQHIITDWWIMKMCLPAFMIIGLRAEEQRNAVHYTLHLSTCYKWLTVTNNLNTAAAFHLCFHG